MTRQGRQTRHRPRRGVALVVVLWTVLVLATVTAVAGSASRGSADLAAAHRAGSVSRAMAESGIVAAVARIDAGLRQAGPDTASRAVLLDAFVRNAEHGTPVDADTLGDGVFAVTIVDVSARLDVNEAGAEGWAILLTPFVGRGAAGRIAGAIDARVRGDGSAIGSAREEDARDSLVAALLGRDAGVRRRRPIESVDELLEIPELTPSLLQRIVPFLTVDGDGRVNRRGAPPEVLAAAAGSLVDQPVRLLLVSRGWLRGHPRTREIEAVYDVADDGLRLVRWRERER